MKRLEKFLFREIESPFTTDKEQSSVFKRLFTSVDGEKVLDSLILDMDYHKPDLPVGQDVAMQMAFHNGKRYVINHILSAIRAEYDKIEDDND